MGPQCQPANMEEWEIQLAGASEDVCTPIASWELTLAMLLRLASLARLTQTFLAICL